MGISGFLQFIYYLYTVNTTFYRIHMGIFSKIFSSFVLRAGSNRTKTKNAKLLTKDLRKPNHRFSTR